MASKIKIENKTIIGILRLCMPRLQLIKRISRSDLYFLLSLFLGFGSCVIIYILYYYDYKIFGIISSISGIASTFFGICALVYLIRQNEIKKIMGILKFILYLIVVLFLFKFYINQLSRYYNYQSANNSCFHSINIIGNSLLTYLKKSEFTIPPAVNWSDLLLQNNKNITEDIFWGTGNAKSAFAFNANIANMKINKLPDNTVVIFEADGDFNLSGGKELLLDKRAKDKYFLRKKDIFIYIYFVDSTIGRYRIADSAISLYDPDSDKFRSYTTDSPYASPVWTLEVKKKD